jgi:hypothetical protein
MRRGPKSRLHLGYPAWCADVRDIYICVVLYNPWPYGVVNVKWLILEQQYKKCVFP